MCKVSAQLRAAAANKKAEDFTVHPQTNKRFVGANNAKLVRLKI
jgi:hypothetical protein